MSGSRYAKLHVQNVGLLLALQAGVFSLVASAASVNVVYPRPESVVDVRNDYYIQLLDLVLKKSGVEYTPGPHQIPMDQSRAILQLRDSDGIDVLWTMTSREREAAMLPIRVPLDKGLLGWRIFLIKKRDRGLFENIHSLNDLKKYTAGLGHDWPDTEIMHANGLHVIVGDTYEGLFRMLQADRFQYFPRGILEIPGEEKGHPNLDIEVEKTLALHYPTAIYFFVNKRNTALAHLLEQGLQNTIADGSFEKLFEQFNGGFIKQAQLKTRRVIELNNPLLSNATPLSNKALWFKP